MRKVVLIMDDPEYCHDCSCCKIEGIIHLICKPTDKYIFGDYLRGQKPPFCPLKTLPTPKEPIYKYESDRKKYTDYARGWNACLEAIGGNNEN